MKNLIIYILAALLLSLTVNAEVADLEITSAITEFDDLNLGDVGVFEFIIRNNGPDQAGSSSVATRPISVGTEIPLDDTYKIDFFSSGGNNQNCLLITSIGEPRPGNPVVVFYTFYFEPLNPGEVVSCSIEFLVVNQLSIHQIEWSLLNTDQGDTDPDSTNNSINLTFRGFVPQVTTLGPFSLLIMILIFLVFTFFKNTVSS